MNVIATQLVLPGPVRTTAPTFLLAPLAF